MFFKFWELIINIMEAFLFIIFTNKKLNKRQQITKSLMFQTLVALIGSISLFLLNIIGISTSITVILSFLFHLIFVQLFFSNTMFTKFLWTTLYTIYGVLSDSLTVIIPIYWLHYTKEVILTPSGITRIAFTLLYILIFTLLIVLTLNSDSKTFQLSKTERFIFSAISILCIIIEQIVLISIINYTNEFKKSELNNQVLVFILVFFLFFSLVFYVYNLGIQKEKNKILIEENMLSKLSNNQYEHVTSQIEELRVIKHDINNHLKALSLLIEAKENKEAINYISSITEDLGKHHYLISSGNLPIDCIVSSKLMLAQTKFIPIDYTIHLPSSIPISNVDICSLLGNLLDNAIEACDKIDSSHPKYVYLTIKPFNNMLSIKLSNSSDGIYRLKQSGDLLSTKNSISEHGLGIKHIKRIVKKYNGFSRICPETDRFTVEILFPLNNLNVEEMEVNN